MRDVGVRYSTRVGNSGVVTTVATCYVEAEHQLLSSVLFTLGEDLDAGVGFEERRELSSGIQVAVSHHNAADSEDRVLDCRKIGCACGALSITDFSRHGGNSQSKNHKQLHDLRQSGVSVGIQKGLLLELYWRNNV